MSMKIYLLVAVIFFSDGSNVVHYQSFKEKKHCSQFLGMMHVKLADKVNVKQVTANCQEIKLYIGEQ